MANSKQRTKRNHKKEKSSCSIWKQCLIGFFILLSVIAFSALYVLESASKPFEDVETYATEIAKKYAVVDKVSDVTIYNGKETYYTVSGNNKDGQEVFAFIPEKSSKIRVYQANEGLSQEEAEQRAYDNGATGIAKTTLGYQDGHAIWEIKSGTAYYIIDFKTGEFIKKEGL